MKLSRQPRTWGITGLRTRYVPKSRLGRGFISISPWLDFVLILVLFLLLDRRMVLQPGVLVELPRAPFRQGERSSLVVVVLSVRTAQAGEREDIAFFDDEPFRVRVESQRLRLRQALADRVARHGDASLVIQADRQVPHGTVTDIMSMAMGAGIRRVNLAVRTF